MTRYDLNLRFLKANASDLYRTATQEKALYEIEINEVEGQDNCLLKNGNCECFDHSLYSTEEEMRLMFSSVGEDCEALVIFGIGSGKALEYAKRNYRSIKSVIIIEPSLQMFRRFLSRHAFVDVFKTMGKVSVLVNKSEEAVSQYLSGALYEKSDKPYGLVCTASYLSLFSGYYEAVKNYLVKYFRSRTAHTATMHWTKYVWLHNSFKNMNQDSIFYGDVMDYFRGRPAVVISAGPSLNKHLHLLNDLKKKAILVAVGSAMKILDSHGITPHLRAAIDASFNEKIYDDEFFDLSEDIPLLFASHLTEKLLPLYKGRKIFMSLETDMLGNYLNKKMGINIPPVGSGASIANSATWFLSQAGCSHIIFIGQDMCMYDDGLYAEGRSQTSKGDFAEKNIVQMIDIYGNKVQSPRGYLQIKYDFEGRIKSFPNTRYINATEGGIGIDGTEIKPLARVMEEDLENMDFDLNSYIDSQIEKEKYYNLESKKEALLEIRNEIEQLVEINEKVIYKLKKITRKREMGLKTKRLTLLLDEINNKDVARMKEIDFYDSVVLKVLSPVVVALKKKYGESYANNEEKVLAWEKYLNNLTVETLYFIIAVQRKIDGILKIEEDPEEDIVKK